MNKKTILILAILVTLIGCNFDNRNDKSKRETVPLQSGLTYTPNGLAIKEAKWSWYMYTQKTEFQDFILTLSNNTNENFQMVKYRLQLFVRDKEGNRTVFSKSYEYNQRLNTGDVVPIIVTDLSKFYIGVDVSNVDNWSWIATIEDSEVIK